MEATINTTPLQPSPFSTHLPISPLVMDDTDAAAYLGISPHTLRRWRSQGTGPDFICVGRLKKYRLADLEAYTQKQTVVITAAHNGAPRESAITQGTPS